VAAAAAANLECYSQLARGYDALVWNRLILVVHDSNGADVQNPFLPGTGDLSDTRFQILEEFLSTGLVLANLAKA
jgi:hypothetical protein